MIHPILLEVIYLIELEIAFRLPALQAQQANMLPYFFYCDRSHSLAIVHVLGMFHTLLNVFGDCQFTIIIADRSEADPEFFERRGGVEL